MSKPFCWRCLQKPMPKSQDAQRAALCDEHLQERTRKVMGFDRRQSNASHLLVS